MSLTVHTQGWGVIEHMDTREWGSWDHLRVLPTTLNFLYEEQVLEGELSQRSTSRGPESLMLGSDGGGQEEVYKTLSIFASVEAVPS